MEPRYLAQRAEKRHPPAKKPLTKLGRQVLHGACIERTTTILARLRSKPVILTKLAKRGTKASNVDKKSRSDQQKVVGAGPNPLPWQ